MLDGDLLERRWRVNRRLKTAGRAGLLTLVILFLIATSFSRTEARDASLRDIVVTNTRDHLLLYFCGSDCFTDEMVKAIESGMNTAFTFYVRLYEVRDFWWDVEIADLKVSHDIHYDSLKKTYTLKLPETDHEVVVLDDFEKAKKLMSSIVGLKVTELSNLHKGKRYQIRMMAELGKIKLPFYLHHVLFFLSLWDFKTDWYTFDFRF